MTMIRPLRIGGEILQKVLETHPLGTRERAISPHAVEGFLLYRYCVFHAEVQRLYRYCVFHAEADTSP
jgi:hypothetical protein